MKLKNFFRNSTILSYISYMEDDGMNDFKKCKKKLMMEFYIKNTLFQVIVRKRYSTWR